MDGEFLDSRERDIKPPLAPAELVGRQTIAFAIRDSPHSEWTKMLALCLEMRPELLMGDGSPEGVDESPNFRPMNRLLSERHAARN